MALCVSALLQLSHVSGQGTFDMDGFLDNLERRLPSGRNGGGLPGRPDRGGPRRNNRQSNNPPDAPSHADIDEIRDEFATLFSSVSITLHTTCRCKYNSTYYIQVYISIL